MKSSSGEKNTLSRKTRPLGRFAEKFTLLELLGEGGVGKVYRARQDKDDRIVGIKIMSDFDEWQFARFTREAETTRNLDHPNILKVFEHGKSESDAYIVMECLKGASLAQIIKNEFPIKMETVISIIEQSACGLGYAHWQKVVHRDIKPSNIIVTAGDTRVEVKIVDFGIAKLLGGATEGEPRLSKTGEVFGTPYYMSPEQIQAKEIDHRSDIYALGCVFYECLTGSPPFIGGSSFETANMHLNEEPLSLKEASLGGTFPESVESVVSKMLKKSPSDRYQSMEEFIEALNGIPKSFDIEVVETKEICKKRETISQEQSSLSRIDMMQSEEGGSVQNYQIYDCHPDRTNLLISVVILVLIASIWAVFWNH